MVIHVDIHGVLANLAGAIVAEYNKRHGTSWTHDDVKNWDWSPVILPDQNWQSYTSSQNFWQNLPLYPWAKKLVNAVKASGYTCAFLSDLPKGTENDHRIWLDKHFGSDASEHLIITSRKDLVASHKGSITIDDSPNHIQAIRAARGFVYALAQPWNTHIIHRYTPEEIIAAIRSLKHG